MGRANFRIIYDTCRHFGAYAQAVLAVFANALSTDDPLSGLVVQIDELLAADEPTSADAEALLNQARGLLRPDENGEGFARRYHRAIQDVPDVLIAHVALGKHLL